MSYDYNPWGTIKQWKWNWWKSTSPQDQWYDYTYDKLGRLTGGVHSGAYSESGMSYDENGNILYLHRTLGTNWGYSLAYAYTGNHLTTINYGEYQFAYDDNGNTTQDTHSGENYSYNFLNLLQKVSNIADGSVKANYLWRGDGTKASVKDATGKNGFEYLGSLIYKRENGALSLDRAQFGDGAIESASGGPVIDYFYKDHLGSVRAVTGTDGGLKQQNDYYPYGMRMNRVNYVASDNRFLYNGKELQTTGGTVGIMSGNALDYGARMLNTWLGPHWNNPDPMAELDYSVSPYVYCHDNPVSRIDIGGNWDIDVHVYKDRAEYGGGVAVVTDRNGNEVQRLDVRAEGVGGHDRNVQGADTPLGTYDIPAGDTWRSSTDDNRASYGPNDRLVMTPASGEIVQTGRDGIRMHGGRQETYNSETGTWSSASDPSLQKTEGCLRAYDSDMATLKTTTTGLQQNDSKESPGQVRVVDDLKKVTVPASSTNMVEVQTKYEVPKPDDFHYNGINH